MQHQGRCCAVAATTAAATGSTASAAHARVLSSFMEMQQQRQQGTQARPPALVCVTKEVPLPRELRDASESLRTMLCEDALQAFQVNIFSLLPGLADWSFT